MTVRRFILPLLCITSVSCMPHHRPTTETDIEISRQITWGFIATVLVVSATIIIVALVDFMKSNKR